ncbi:class II fructose-bisphosphate aldolase [Facklamia languida]
MKVNSNKVLPVAQKIGFAIPATNFIDLDSARTFVKVAEERRLPLILAFAESHRQIISLEEAALIGNYFVDKATVPIVLHLDHGTNPEFIFKAIELGFSSVMIDASQKDFEDNIKITKEIVDYAHKHHVSVEAELGHVGSEDLTEAYELSDSIYTEVKDVIEFVDRTNVDSLAISIGTAHGVYKGEPKINFERLKEIKEIAKVPLVLHGGSSSGDENLSRCAANGISKINIFTDFINGALHKIEKGQAKNYLVLKELANLGMEEVLKHYYDVFGTQSIEG